MESRGVFSVGGLTVVCGAFPMTSGKFAPVYRVFAGSDMFATPIRRQDYPSPGPNFHTLDDAVTAAASMARSWIASTSLR